MKSVILAFRLGNVFFAEKYFFRFCLTKAELLALTMEDFDFEKNTVRINKSYQRLQGRDYITSPKTAKSNRTIKLPKFLAEEMQEYFAMLYDQTPTDRIFQVTKSFLHHEMERGSEAAGVKKIRIHDLRHSHISHLIDLGFSAVAIADRVGHESIDITYRYSHLFPSKQVAMADTLDAVNASFDDCEEVADDIDMEAAELEHDKAEPMIDLDAVMGGKDSVKDTGDTAKSDESDKTVKAVTEVTGSTVCAEPAKSKVVSIEQYRVG